MGLEILVIGCQKNAIDYPIHEHGRLQSLQISTEINQRLLGNASPLSERYFMCKS
jgi:hypothetical protein